MRKAEHLDHCLVWFTINPGIIWCAVETLGFVLQLMFME